MAKSVPIAALATANAPEDYTIPDSLEIVPLAVRASFDGTGASGAFYPTLEFVAPGGVVIAECPCFTTIAAGGSADVTWFHIDQGVSTGPAQSAYEISILSTLGIRAYWKLDETSGTIAYDSANAHYNLTYQNGVAIGQPPLADGHSATLTSAAGQRIGDRIAPPGQAGIQGNGQMTIEGWLKTSSSTLSYPVSSYSASADGDFFSVRMETTGKLTYIIYGTDQVGHGLTSNAAINDGAKHYFACTFDATTMKLYIDGALDNSTVPAMGGFPLSDHNEGVVLGANFQGFPGYQDWFNGTLDEVSLYDLAISAADVAAHYALGVA